MNPVTLTFSLTSYLSLIRNVELHQELRCSDLITPRAMLHKSIYLFHYLFILQYQDRLLILIRFTECENGSEGFLIILFFNQKLLISARVWS